MILGKISGDSDGKEESKNFSSGENKSSSQNQPESDEMRASKISIFSHNLNESHEQKQSNNSDGNFYYFYHSLFS